MIVALAGLGAVLGWQFLRRDRPPHHAMIDEAYFICSRCGSAQGGVYGKGPFKDFRSEAASRCVHDWRRVSREEFKQFAGKAYHADWNAEIPFWSR
jgi:hypothetical protein